MGLGLKDGKWARKYEFYEEFDDGHTRRQYRLEHDLGFMFTSHAHKVTVTAPSGEYIVYILDMPTDKFYRLAEDTRRK